MLWRVCAVVTLGVKKQKTKQNKTKNKKQKTKNKTNKQKGNYLLSLFLKGIQDSVNKLLFKTGINIGWAQVTHGLKIKTIRVFFGKLTQKTNKNKNNNNIQNVINGGMKDSDLLGRVSA